MDKRIKILIEKRKQLGWTIKQLAEKADLSYGEALHVERKGIYCDTYVSKLKKALEKGINDRQRLHISPKLKYVIKKASEDRQDWNRISSLINKEKERSSTKKVYAASPKKSHNWSRKHGECVFCGTTEIKHAGHGLCKTCYDRDIEEKQKSHDRKAGVAGKKLTKKYLVEEYLIKQKSLNDIAKACACTRQYVHKKMKEFNIPSRDITQARGLAYRKGKLSGYKIDEDGQKNTIVYQKKEVDEDFFSSWSNEMAYVLGVFYSDGNIYQERGRHTCSVSQKEPELLNKIKFIMKCDAELSFKKRRKSKSGVSGELYTFSLQNKKIFGDLIKLGLTPNKSLSIDFPEIPREYVRHFIRGCWDGDGSVYIGSKSKVIRASYTSGSLNFIKGMLNEFEKAGLKKRTIYTIKRKNPSYYFRFSGFSQCKDLYHYLYDNVSSEQFLQRKFDVFKIYFNENKIEIEQQDEVRWTQSGLNSVMDELDTMITIKRITSDQVIDHFNQSLHLKKHNNDAE